MHWPVTVSWIAFFAIPGGLWAIGALANRGHGPAAKILGFTVGSDNRLSLSRLQAFLWTLVIFGSFAAAMAIHTPIKSATAEEIKEANDAAKKTADEAASKLVAYQAAKTDEAKAKAASQAAHDASSLAQAEAKAREENARSHPETDKEAKEAQDAEVKAANKKVADAKVDEVAKGALLSEKAQAVAGANTSWEQADAEAKKAQQVVQSYAWVQIPSALLALAGIAIGSGVFSSLIAAIHGDAKTASITSLSGVAASSTLSVPPGEKAETRTANLWCLVIGGSDLGDSGRVLLSRKRFGKRAARVIYWKKDGTGIAAELPDDRAYGTLVVETSHGKLAYNLTGSTPDFKLGASRTQYDFADLFRDDQNPESLSLMKFQMFGWTVIAIFIYVYLFLTNLSSSITTLPVVDSSIVILTGVSQAGYLAGKGVSNVPPSPSHP